MKAILVLVSLLLAFSVTQKSEAALPNTLSCLTKADKIDRKYCVDKKRKSIQSAINKRYNAAKKYAKKKRKDKKKKALVNELNTEVARVDQLIKDLQVERSFWVSQRSRAEKIKVKKRSDLEKALGIK